MSYDPKYHNEHMCDKCCKYIGKHRLFPVPFLYHDVNDLSHPDVSELLGLPKGSGYRQYYVCKACKKKEVIKSTF